MSDPSKPARERSPIEDIIDIYKKDVDMTLLRENLKPTKSDRSLVLGLCLAEIGAATRNARRLISVV